MKVLKDTLSVLIERWEDPGDYPNAVASGPLPSYDYFAGVEGSLTLELTAEELTEYQEFPDEFLENADIDLPRGVSRVVTWQKESLEGNVLTLGVLEAVASDDCCDNDGPEYDPEERVERREWLEEQMGHLDKDFP